MFLVCSLSLLSPKPIDSFWDLIVLISELFLFISFGEGRRNIKQNCLVAPRLVNFIFLKLLIEKLELVCLFKQIVIEPLQFLKFTSYFDSWHRNAEKLKFYFTSWLVCCVNPCLIFWSPIFSTHAFSWKYFSSIWIKSNLEHPMNVCLN